MSDQPARPDVDALQKDETVIRQFINDGADGNRARRALDRIMEALATSPARDAAEETYDLLMRLRDYLDINRRPGNDLSPKFSAEISAVLASIEAAPPKPAPDAARGRDKERPIIVHCIGLLIEKFGTCPIEAAWNIFDYIGQPKNLAALAAPVPPADGAMRVSWRWKPRGSITWIYDPHPIWFAEHKNEIDHEPLYTLPPIRGDREAIADAFAKKFPAAIGQYSQYKFVDWFLSIPAQPPQSNSDGEGR